MITHADATNARIQLFIGAASPLLSVRLRLR